MKKSVLKRIVAHILCITLVFGMISIPAAAEDEMISVVLKFNAACVANDLDGLYSDLLLSGEVGENITNVPGEISLEVPKGTTVKEIIEAAKEKQDFTVIGLEENYITQVGFVGATVLEKLVSIPVANYTSNNIFSSAGWFFFENGEMLSSGIGDAVVSENNSVIEAKFGLCIGWDSNWNAIYYDELFLEGYNKLDQLAKKEVDISEFTEEEKNNYTEAKAEAEKLVSEIYGETNLNDEVSQRLKEKNENFKTSGGMWIGYYEKYKDEFFGENSKLSQLENALKRLNEAISPTSDNLLFELFVSNSSENEENNLVSFSRVKTEYIINDFSDEAVFLKALSENENSIISVTLNDEDADFENSENGFKKISGLDWEERFLNTLKITVNPPAESASAQAIYTVKLYRSLTDEEKISEAKKLINWDSIKGENSSDKNITSALLLPESVKLADNLGELSVSWVSSDEGLIKNNGEFVKKPEKQTIVTLTATITSGEKSDTKAFDVVPELMPESELRLARISALLENISKSYIEKSSYWEVMDMGAFASYAPESENKITDEAKKQLISSAIADIEKTDKDTDLSKIILALTAVGYDAREIYKKNKNLPINAVEKLNNVPQSASAWSAPYTLAAYNRSEYSSKENELKLVNALLQSQKEDGSWDEFGTIDTTANVITALSFYSDYEDEEIKNKVNIAIEKAVTYLSSMQNSDGSFSDLFSGKNSNSTAMVVMALAAVGVDLEKDESFIKNGNTVLDGLLSFVLEDNSGVGFLDNSSVSEYSTEQAFRAFIAAIQAIKTKKAYNIYDFSENQLAAAKEESEQTGGGGIVVPPSGDSDEDEKDKIVVKVTVKAEDKNWIKNYKTTIYDDSPTIYHAIVKACEENDIIVVGAESGYVVSMTYKGTTLAEFDNGAGSGWLYKLNGEVPLFGIKECDIKDGDTIVFYYTSDYTSDEGASSGWYVPSDTSSKDENKEEQSDKDKEEQSDKNEEDEKPTDENEEYSDIEGHWAEKAIKHISKAGLMKGTDKDKFSPDTKLNRGMFVTILYRLAGEPEVFGESFKDVKSDDYFADAVLWASENEIVAGTGEDNFSPHKKISREEIAVILYRYSKKVSGDEGEHKLSEYEDSEQISEWAKDAVLWATGCGLIKGRTNKMLAPKETATRAEIAEIFLRYTEKF